MIPMTLGEIGAALGAECPADCREARVRAVSTDSRETRGGDLFFAIAGQRFDGHDFVGAAFARGATAAVVQRPVSSAMPPVDENRPLVQFVVDDTVAALGRLAVYYRQKVMQPETIVVGVTGSNGKTTTKSMIDHVLRRHLPGKASPKSFNNLIGVPLTLLSVEGKDRYVVAELGMNAPGEIGVLAGMARPHVGVITSIGEAHLEGLGSIEGIAREKASLLDHVQRGGLGVVNVDRGEILPHLQGKGSLRMLTVGRNAPASFRIGRLRGSLSGTAFELDGRYAVELRLPGFHHASNAAATFVVGRWFGISPEDVVASLAGFTAAEGRTRVLTLGTARVVDDSYNANPASVLAAIEVLAGERPGYRAMLLGDMLELGSASDALHEKVVGAVAAAGIETLITVGERMNSAVARLRTSARATRIEGCADLSEAFEVAGGFVASGHTLWIKGSRGMQLDLVVRQLAERFSAQAAVA